MKEKTIRSKIVFRGPFFLLREHQIVTPDGEKKKRIILEHPGAAAAVPLLPDGRVILVRQYRKALERETLEIPAGKLEKGEAPKACIRRELIEEIGFRAAKLEKLISYCPSPGICNEIIHIYLARDLREASLPGADETSLKTVILPLAEVRKRIASERIQDSKTIIGFWALRMKRRGVRQEV